MRDGVVWEVLALSRLTELMNRVSAQDDLSILFDMVVDGAADVVGFKVAAISLVVPSGDIEVVAVAGDDDARTELLGRRTPRPVLEAEFAVAERWGSLRFVPAGELPDGSAEGWVSADWTAPTPAGDPDAWNPEDTLIAPFFDAVGELLGILSVDLPLSGRRPDVTQRAVLELFANQTGIAISAARQRHALSERVRLGEAVQTVARIAQEDLDPARVVDVAAMPISAGLASAGLWLRAFAGEDDDERESVSARSGERVHTPVSLVAIARRMAARCWRAGVVAVVGADGHVTPARLWSDDDIAQVRVFLSDAAARSLLIAPMGSGSSCFGYIACTRGPGDPDWTDAEAQAALEMGRDLGRAIRNARLYAVERRVAAELREADRSKTQLFSTVSHELKNPLASIVGHVELLRQEPDADGDWSLGVIERNTERLQSLVDDLLTLSRVSDPDRAMPEADVDLGEVSRDVVDMFRPRADTQQVSLTFDLEERLPLVRGSAGDLERVVQNLVSNAVKFTPAGGKVAVSVASRRDRVVLECTDDGLGISPEDQEGLFTEFFRGTNPETLQVPGTGLGLSIAQRVVTRHGGRIDVDSELGRGTSVTLLLPAL
ncbi:cell wall metabolism sensor histidine kinase WalK [Terracoccus sp. 273MFTsu3.1]|uniref:sensor histidine kinase n=1 Tax=Terracoccus sp. 273MFTsu3.1 TaxID=1172188 RepID=UPI00037F643A|nr:HAMP domain-containing sensor histidine kinase [Terracoccus sp. 273MFTsu3.1]